MKIATWNVNGIRAAAKNGFLAWLEQERPDVCALQEIKATPEQVDSSITAPWGYATFWHPAKKPGYSGVALFSRVEPISVQNGIGIEEIDCEGRVITAEFKNFTLIGAYFPNSQREGARLDYKLRFCSAMAVYCEKLRGQGKNLVLCGDFNIAHKEIDLKFPKANENNAGFLPEERGWMDEFTGMGYVDSFRYFEKGPGHYTWWSYRPGVRARNIGWRLDYHVVNPEFADRMKSSEHRTAVLGSDHCPVVLTLKR